jgi:hypothetical protein
VWPHAGAWCQSHAPQASLVLHLHFRYCKKSCLSLMTRTWALTPGRSAYHPWIVHPIVISCCAWSSVLLPLDSLSLQAPTPHRPPSPHTRTDTRNRHPRTAGYPPRIDYACLTLNQGTTCYPLVLPPLPRNTRPPDLISCRLFFIVVSPCRAPRPSCPSPFKPLTPCRRSPMDPHGTLPCIAPLIPCLGPAIS